MHYCTNLVFIHALILSIWSWSFSIQDQIMRWVLVAILTNYIYCKTNLSSIYLPVLYNCKNPSQKVSIIEMFNNTLIVDLCSSDCRQGSSLIFPEMHFRIVLACLSVYFSRQPINPFIWPLVKLFGVTLFFCFENIILIMPRSDY